MNITDLKSYVNGVKSLASKGLSGWFRSLEWSVSCSQNNKFSPHLSHRMEYDL